MKTVWITALTKDKDRVGMAATTLKRYGMQSQGHFWLDEPDKATARVVLDAMLAAKADAWIVLADATSLAGHGVRYGLSLLAASLAAERGAAMPTVCLWPAGTPEDVMSTAHLPALLHTAAGFIENGPTWAVKLVAALAKPAASPHSVRRREHRTVARDRPNVKAARGLCIRYAKRRDRGRRSSARHCVSGGRPARRTTAKDRAGICAARFQDADRRSRIHELGRAQYDHARPVLFRTNHRVPRVTRVYALSGRRRRRGHGDSDAVGKSNASQRFIASETRVRRAAAIP
jgi:hypothetical protein